VFLWKNIYIYIYIYISDYCSKIRNPLASSSMKNVGIKVLVGTIILATKERIHHLVTYPVKASSFHLNTTYVSGWAS